MSTASIGDELYGKPVGGLWFETKDQLIRFAATSIYQIERHTL
jgi:hypothetical protein